MMSIKSGATNSKCTLKQQQQWWFYVAKLSTSKCTFCSAASIHTLKKRKQKMRNFVRKVIVYKEMQVFCFKEKTCIFNKFLKTAYVHFSRFISIFLESCFWCIIMFIELKISHWRATRLGLLFFSFPVCYSIWKSYLKTCKYFCFLSQVAVLRSLK